MIICSDINCKKEAVYIHRGMNIYLCEEHALIFEYKNCELLEIK